VSTHTPFQMISAQGIGLQEPVVVVTAASIQDRKGALQLLDFVRHTFSRLRLPWADRAYAGDLLAWVWALRHCRQIRLDIVQRPESTKGFQLLPKRWMVESSQLSYPDTDNFFLPYNWPDRLVASRDPRGQVPDSGRGRERELMSTHVLPPAYRPQRAHLAWAAAARRASPTPPVAAQPAAGAPAERRSRAGGGQ
jgi:hypothetical protein